MGWREGAWADGAWAGTAWAIQSAPVEVPDVVGESEATGTATLEGEGFVVSVSPAYSDSVAAGLIISQDPAGGEFAAAGSTVEIVVSLGPAPEPPVLEPQGGDDAWHGPLSKQRDYRPELDERRKQEREQLRETIARAAGLIQEAEEVAAEVESPELAGQVETLRTAFTSLRNEAEAIDLEAVQRRVDALLATAVNALVLQIADVLTDLIQEIADDSEP